LAAGHGWWTTPEEKEFTSKYWLEEMEVFQGLDVSIDFLKKYWQEKGPFDGIFGFSQGTYHSFATVFVILF
jgi:hypothetical protein